MKELITMSTSAVAEKRLLAAVVAKAISDCCIKPLKSKEEKLAQAKIHPHAFTAMRFIFDTSVPGLDAYAQWLDFTPEVFREKLLAFSQDVTPGKKDHLDSEERKMFRHNYFLFRKMTKAQVLAMAGEYTGENDE